MNANVKLGKIANVPIVLAFDWWLIVIGYTLYALMSSSVVSAANTFLAIMAISGIVLLHELGHMFMAKRFGAKTNSITLHCFGGLAAINMHDWPKLLNKPKRSLLVWLAGPAVNIVLFGLLWLVVPFVRQHQLAMQYVVYLMFVNASLAIFNLLPVFPMDGSGIMYSVLRMITTRSRAIKITSIVGIIGSAGFILLALKFHMVMLGFIGLMTLMASIQAPKHPLYK